MKSMTINNALDQVLDLKSKFRILCPNFSNAKARKNLDELHNLSDELLNMKIDLGGRTELSDEILIKVKITLDKNKKVN